MVLNPNLITQHVIPNKTGTIKHVNVNVKIIESARKISLGIEAHIYLIILSN